MKFKTKKAKAIISVIIAISLITSIFAIKSFAENLSVKLTVNADEVIQEDYIGVGGNFWTGCMTEEGIEYLDMTEAHLDLNIKRIQTVKPAFMRMVVMPHYMVDFDDNGDGVVDENDVLKGENNWKNGKYDFESDYMKNFFAYAKAFKDAGTEIELNFGNACSQDIKDWYAIKGTADADGGNRSAPDDLEAFAKACSALIQECFSRGLDNVKYVCFYNEVCHVEYGAFGDRRLYWCEMLKRVHEQLKADGIRDDVKIIGSDCDTQFKYNNGGDAAHYEFLDYVKKNASEYYDLMSVHLYWAWDYNSDRQLRNIADMEEYCRNVLKDHPNTLVTEFSYGTNNAYDVSRSGQVLAHSNTGIGGSAFWFFCGTYIPDPLNTYRKDPHELWDSPSKEGVDKVNTTFGEMGLLMRYIPKHSKVLKSASNSNDVRIAVYNKGDDFTAVVETNNNIVDRNLTIDFGTNINKKFRKHVYVYPDDINNSQFDANAILPVSEKEITLENGTLTDTVSKEHCLIIYTTLDEEEQIALNSVEQSVIAGSSVQFSVTEKIAVPDNSKVTWEVVTGGGTIDESGKYTATGVSSGDVVSVKASVSGSNAYAIAIVKIK